jgi:hypothetical protein
MTLGDLGRDCEHAARIRENFNFNFPFIPVMLPWLAGQRFVGKTVVESCIYSRAVISSKHSPWPDGR